jgi:hypothetical protein
MATLLETLKKNLGGVGASTAPIADETGQVQQLLAAKKGIVGPATALGPKGLSVAEAAARGQTQQQLQQVGQQAGLQATALEQAAAGQQQEQRQQEQRIEAQRAESNLRNKVETENVLRNLEQNKASIKEDQRQAGIEQVGAMLRFQNEDYIRNLQREGDRARLRDKIAFDEQLTNDIFADNIAGKKLFYANEALFDASDRDFNKEVAKIDINTALQMAKENAAFSQRQAQVQGVAEIAKTGVSVYGQQQAGAFSGDYQSYAESTREKGGTPVSYTTWQSRNKVTVGPGEQLPASTLTSRTTA